MAAGTLVEAAQLELLVRAMDLIVLEAESHQQRIKAELGLERLHDGNRSARADHRRLAPVLLSQRRRSFAHEAAVGRNLDAWSGAEQGNFELRIRRDSGLHEVLEAL